MNSISETGNYDNDYITPFKGNLTDVNIWDKILTQEERISWSKCIGEESGNFLDWTNVHIIHSEQIKELDIPKSTICKEENSSKFIAFSHSLEFEESLIFCHDIGGELAVSEDNENIDEMKRAIMQVKEKVNPNCSDTVYAGYWKKEGNYENAVTHDKKNLTIVNNHSAFDQCVLVNLLESGKLYKDRCQLKQCPICYFPDWPTELQLRGISIEEAEEIDSNYYLLNSTHLMGKTKSQIIHEGQSWKIYNYEMEALFHTDTGITKFPLGLNDWILEKKNKSKNKNNISTCNFKVKPTKITDSVINNCNNNKKRQLKINLAVEQPGNICCNDGSCGNSGGVQFLAYLFYTVMY